MQTSSSPFHRGSCLPALCLKRCKHLVTGRELEMILVLIVKMPVKKVNTAIFPLAFLLKSSDTVVWTWVYTINRGKCMDSQNLKCCFMLIFSLKSIWSRQSSLFRIVVNLHPVEKYPKHSSSSPNRESVGCSAWKRNLYLVRAEAQW